MTDFYLFRTAMKDLLQLKKALVGILLALMPALIALLWRVGAKDDFREEIAYNLLAAALIFGFVLVIMSVVFCTGVIVQEVEQKTIMYLLTRPVPRWRIALMKFFAATLVTTVVAWISCILLAAVVYGPGGINPAPTLKPSQIKDPKGLVVSLKDSQDAPTFYLHNLLSPALQEHMDGYNEEQNVSPALASQTVSELNALLEKSSFYDKEAFADVKLSKKTQDLMANNGGSVAANRALLEDTFPDFISPFGSPLPRVGRDLLILPLGALAYGAVFLLLATLLNRPLIAGLLFAFGWESWVPSMNSDFQKLSIMAYLRVLAPHVLPDTSDQGANEALAIFNPTTIAPRLAWIVTFSIIAIGLVCALYIFSTREYVPRDDA